MCRGPGFSPPSAEGWEPALPWAVRPRLCPCRHSQSPSQTLYPDLGRGAQAQPEAADQAHAHQPQDTEGPHWAGKPLSERPGHGARPAGSRTLRPQLATRAGSRSTPACSDAVMPPESPCWVGPGHGQRVASPVHVKPTTAVRFLL